METSARAEVTQSKVKAYSTSEIGEPKYRIRVNWIGLLKINIQTDKYCDDDSSDGDFGIFAA
jgi:hypothetical protein